MKSTTAVAIAALLVGSANAYGYDTPAVCNDACANAVSGNGAYGHKEVAEADCRNFVVTKASPVTVTATTGCTQWVSVQTDTTTTTTLFSIIGETIVRASTLTSAQLQDLPPWATTSVAPAPPPAYTGTYQKRDEAEHDNTDQEGAEMPFDSEAARTTLLRRYAYAENKAVPGYAAACNSQAYASACNCMGITATIQEQAPVTTTITSFATATTTQTTATHTVTVTKGVCDPNDGYGLNYAGGRFDGKPQIHNWWWNHRTFPPAPKNNLKECCSRCYNTPNCFFFDVAQVNRQCRIYYSTKKANPKPRKDFPSNSDVCDIGLVKGFGWNQIVSTLSPLCILKFTNIQCCADRTEFGVLVPA